jgi:hypothetical protein
MVYVPDKRTRYNPVDCKDQETNYSRWIVEAWERLLVDHFRNIEDPENALVSRELWFDNLPAVMRVRVTTPNVLRALRKRDPGAAKPYNFAHSPILVHPLPNCTLIAPASKNSSEWLIEGLHRDLQRKHGHTRGRAQWKIPNPANSLKCHLASLSPSYGSCGSQRSAEDRDP